MLEAGPAEPLVHNHAVLSEDEALRRWLIPESDPFFVRPWRASSPPHFTTHQVAERVGGRALYWYGVSIPMDDWALQSWPEEVRRELAGDAGGVGLFEEIMGELSSWTGRDLMDREPIGNFAGFAPRCDASCSATASGWEVGRLFAAARVWSWQFARLKHRREPDFWGPWVVSSGTTFAQR